MPHPAAADLAAINADIAKWKAANGQGSAPAPAATQPATQQAAAPAAPTAPQPPAAPVAPAPAAPAAPSLDMKAEMEAMQRRIRDAEAMAERYQADAKRAREEAEAREAAVRGEADTLSKQLEQLRKDIEARDRAAREADMDRLLAGHLENTEHLAPEAARELVDKVLKPVINTIQERTAAETAALRAQVESVQQAAETRFEAMTEEQRLAARRAINTKILEAHPDFLTLRESQAFKEFSGRTIPGSRSRTFGDEIADAYQAGDYEYVNKQIATFKDGKPRVTDVLDVDTSAPSLSATKPATDVTKPVYSYEYLKDLKFEFQSGRISRETYSEKLNEFRTAEKEGRVR